VALLSKQASNLLLSLFSGADLFARGFEEQGWCVVSAGDVTEIVFQ
jgi:hypothetical protein